MRHSRTLYHSTSDPEEIYTKSHSNQPIKSVSVRTYRQRVKNTDEKKNYSITVIIGNPHPRGQVTMSTKLPSVGWEPRCEPDGGKTTQAHCVEHTVPAHDVILQREGEQ